MSLIADRLRNKKLFEALVQDRASRLGLSSKFAPDAMRNTLSPRRDEILELIAKYSANGASFEVLEKGGFKGELQQGVNV